MNNRHGDGGRSADRERSGASGVESAAEATGVRLPAPAPMLRPDHDGALLSLREGLIALAHEEIDFARTALERAASLDPELADTHAYLSSALLASADFDGARDAVERALALDPGGFAPLIKAGELEMRLGDPLAAEAHFLGALRAAEPGSQGGRGGQGGARAGARSCAGRHNAPRSPSAWPRAMAREALSGASSGCVPVRARAKG